MTIHRPSWSARIGAFFGAMAIVSGLFVVSANVAASPTSFVNITNLQPRYTTSGTYDWANSGIAPNTNTCAAGEIHVTGSNGLYDCGKFNGTTTPPTAPKFLPTSDTTITAQSFTVDPLSVDHTTCALSNTPVTGDPTTYTGAGSEKNGTLLSTDTWGSTSVPNKDDISNVAAISHTVPGPNPGDPPSVNELFFAAERVINNGDSHIDLEFLQSAVGLVSDGTGCAGTFSGDRRQGDLLLAIDYANGGGSPTNTLYTWRCLADGATQPAVGTVCNPPNHGQSVPHYFQTGNSAVTFGTNGTTAVATGGWASRNADGTQASNIAANEFMEGGIDLKQLGFTGCISTFLPHTRSTKEITAVLKDFALIPFNTCAPSTSLSVSPSASQLIHKGDSVTFTFHELNNGNVTLTSPSVVMTSTGTDTCTPAFVTGGDTNSNGKLDPGETWDFSCSVTFNTAGSFTITGTGHGLFNGNDFSGPSEVTNTTVRVISPATTLVKTVDHNTIHSGDTVIYTYTETNGSTGGNGASDLAIGSVVVTDDKCSPVTGPAAGGDANTNGKLDVGETWVFTCTLTNVTANTTNIALATGTDAIGFAVKWCTNPNTPPASTICSQTERSTQTVTVISPNTSLQKLVTAVANVVYTYNEKNTGDVILTSPAVTDDNCATVTQVLVSGKNVGDTNTDGNFDPNEIWQFTCSKTALITVDTDTGTATIGLTGTVQNTALGDAIDPLGKHITFANGYTNEKDQTTVTLTVSHP
jgi:hypothetical protein